MGMKTENQKKKKDTSAKRDALFLEREGILRGDY